MSVEDSGSSTTVHLRQCVVLGGSGHAFAAGDPVNVRFSRDTLVVQAADEDTKEEIPYPEIVDLTITGSGSVTTGGGFIGGGFGVEGALEGMAVATILNLLTARTKIHTFIAIVTHLGELHLHYGGMEPGALRIALSEVFTRLRRLDPVWLRARLARLEALREQQVLSDGEFERLKQRLLTPPVPPIRASRIASQVPEQTACPSCGAQVYSTAKICGSCWKPLQNSLQPRSP